MADAAVPGTQLRSADPSPSAAAGAMPETVKLMAGKRGLIMGVANDHSIAWGIAQAAHRHGAALAFTYQNDTLGRRVQPLAKQLDSAATFPCDVEDPTSLDSVFGELESSWGGLDFVVHAIAYSDKDELRGSYVDTTQDNFQRTLTVSCYSFTAIAQRARRLMADGGSLLTLTYHGAERVMPHYNVMGVAKAALEASVRYLAVDLGPSGIRVNAISAGPMRTLAGSAVGAARQVYSYSRENAPLQRSVTLGDLGGASLYLLSDLSAGVTGSVHYVDCGIHIVGMPKPDTPTI